MSLLNRRLINRKTLVLGGLAVAAVAGALKNRERVAGLIGVRSSVPEPQEPAGPAPAPAPSNYDVSGPPSNTSTPVPAPEPVIRESGIDEAAEERAAAAEAAAIGGSAPEYAGRELGETADEEFRPLAEAGQGDSEGEEEAEALLRDYAEPTAGDPIEGGRQIEDVIEQAGERDRGEFPEQLESLGSVGRGDREQAVTGAREPLSPPQHPSGPARQVSPPEEPVHDRAPGDAPGSPRPGEGRSQDSSGSSGSALGEVGAGGVEESRDAEGQSTGGALGEVGGGRSAAEKSAAVWGDSSGARDAGERKSADDDESEWQTWSGRAVDR